MRENEEKIVYEMLSKYLNNYLVDEESFEKFANMVNTDHRTLQQKLFRLMIQVIRRWATSYKEGTYDERNEATCKLSSEIMAMLGFDNWNIPFV